MIAIEEQPETVKISVYGELTLADYRDLEQTVTRDLRAVPKVRLLFDVRCMTGFTLDVAWEEIKFTRAHAHDFRRVAVVTAEQWAPWVSWISATFTDAEVMLFEDVITADAWLAD